MNSLTHRPLIGISANHPEQTSRIADAYCNAVRAAGCVPVLIPMINDTDYLREICNRIDGLVMSGGGDIHPSYFNAPVIPEAGIPDLERDAYDVTLIREAQARQIPMLGICRGMQIINIVFGGDIYQDIAKEYGKALVHSQEEPKHIGTHTVKVNHGSRLASILGAEEIDTNTYHHQAVKRVANEFVASAYTSDGICEAIEHPHYPIIGVQWHPEHHATTGNDAAQQHLFQWLASEADLYHRAKELHSHIVSLDSHTDTPMVWTPETDLGQRSPEAQVDFVKMAEGNLDAVFTVAYIPQQPVSEVSRQKAYDDAVGILTRVRRQVEANADKATICSTPQEIAEAKQHGLRAIVPAVENGFAIGKDLSKLETLKHLGARYITLCHNGDNDICTSAKRSTDAKDGLSDFGREVVKEMNRLGLMIDLSHAGEQTFWDVLEASEAPVVCTHSSARALCNHGRNLTDRQLKALAEKGGVCQVCLYSGFLVECDREATIEDAMQHIGHMVKVAGIEHVGIGSDFDGGGTLLGCRAANEEMALTVALMKRGYSNHDIELIRGGNFLRVWNNIQQYNNTTRNKTYT